MLQVVYVLVCNKDNYFYEQFLISVTSLRLHMKDIEVTLVVDQDTNDYLMSAHSDVKNIVDNVSVYNIPEKYNMTARSRFLKTRMRKIVEGDFLYVDCDTLICDALNEICIIPYSSAVLDCHSEVDESICSFSSVIERANQFAFSVGYQNCHYNSGVLWCKDDDETRTFFNNWADLWEETYQKGVLIDQLSFNEINNRMFGAFREMGGKWNCQIRYGIPYLAEAKIIHYFASNKHKWTQRKFGYYFTDENIYREIRRLDYIPEETMELIRKPKKAFHKSLLVEIKTPDYYVINSNIGAVCRVFFSKWPKLFWLLDSILEKFRPR